MILSKDNLIEENEESLSNKTKNDKIQEYKLIPVDSSENDVEIDILELLSIVWKNRKPIFKFVGVGIAVGLFVAFFSQKEYEAYSTLMPEYSTEGQGGAASLLQQYGGLIGLGNGSYNSNSNAIRVDLYPKIVESISFQKDLIYEEFYFSEYDTTVTIFDFFVKVKDPDIVYLAKSYTIKLPFTILGWVLSEEPKEKVIIEESSQSSDNENSESNILSLSQLESDIIANTKERISVQLDQESGIMSVSVLMPDPVAASQIAEFTIKELTRYLTEYRTEKVLTDLEFIEEQLSKADERFKKTQIALADFRDSNQGSLTAKARTEEQRLNSEYDISFNLKNSLTQRYEESKLKVQEETPIFKTLQPIQVPLEESYPKRSLTIILYFMMSGFLSLMWIFGKRIWESHISSIFVKEKS